MGPEEAKELYETLDAIDKLLGGMDDGPLPDLLTSLMGLCPLSNAGVFEVDPDRRKVARQTAIRWLRDRGYVKGFQN